MTPIEFPQQNTVFAKDQPEYLPLPACVADDGMVITCWKLTLVERLTLLFGGRLWLSQLTFWAALQPQRPSVESPFA